MPDGLPDELKTILDDYPVHHCQAETSEAWMYWDYQKRCDEQCDPVKCYGVHNCNRTMICDMLARAYLAGFAANELDYIEQEIENKLYQL